VVLMGGAVGMDVKVAAMVVLGGVIVNADVTFGQAMGDGGIVGKRKGDRRRENAKRVERGNERRSPLWRENFWSGPTAFRVASTQSAGVHPLGA